MNKLFLFVDKCAILNREQTPMKKVIVYALLSMVFMVPFCAYAEGWTPVQVALWNPVQLFSENKDVYGFRLNLLYGKNQNLTGIDFGGYNAVDGIQSGLQFGLFNFSKDARGIDFGLMNYSFALKGIQMGVVNLSEADISGVQTGIILNSTNLVRGFQIHAGIVGNTATDVYGGQLDLSVPLLGFNYADSVEGIQIDALGFNFVSGTMRGVQIGLYNTAREVHGVQFGLFNFCEKMYGVQIGLLNSISQQKPSIMPIFNVGF
jgi:hypothetical protein